MAAQRPRPVSPLPSAQIARRARLELRRRERGTMGRRLLLQLPLLIWLVVFWVFLWDSISPLTIVGGLLVGIFVTRALYLPPAELGGRVNIVWLAIFAVQFAFAVVLASLQVAWMTIRPRGAPTSSVVAVPLRSRSDLIMTLVAQVTTLIPGSVVVEANRTESVLYLHVLDARNEKAIDKARAEVQRNEERLVHALGSPADVDQINAHRIAEGRKPLSATRYAVMLIGRDRGTGKETG